LSRFLIALYTSLLVYFALTMTMGATGIAEYRRLTEYKSVLEENLADLEALNHNLQDKALILRTEPETLMVYARDLNYYDGNEGVIILRGYETRQNSYPMGKMLAWTRTPRNRTPLFRAAAFLAGAGVYLLLTFLHWGAVPRNKIRA